MCDMKPEEIWETIKLNEKVQPLVDDILLRYNLSTKQGITAALRQAVWTGMCEAKGWND